MFISFHINNVQRGSILPVVLVDLVEPELRGEEYYPEDIGRHYSQSSGCHPETHPSSQRMADCYISEIKKTATLNIVEIKLNCLFVKCTIRKVAAGSFKGYTATLKRAF